MEEIYRPEKFSCTDHIHFKEYFSKLSDLCAHQKTCNVGRIPASLRLKLSRIDMSDRAMIKSTSIELTDKPPDKKQKLDCQNKTVLRTKRIREEKKKKCSLVKRSLVTTTSYADNLENMPSGEVHMGPAEFALSVRIYHPFVFSYDTPQKPNTHHNVKFSHEIIALGSNTLAELRDKILCFNDTGMFPEIDDPFVPLPTRGDAKEEYPSGFIFIDNVFYNDFRHPRSIDYSEVILEWAKKKQIQPLNVATMESTQINQLTPRFGYPYLYLHQGKCEHIVVFTDAWLVSNPNINNYPRYQGVHHFHTKLCILCNATAAQWIVVDSDRLPHVRSFLCSECMFSYMYVDQTKIGSFKLYQFYDKNFII